MIYSQPMLAPSPFEIDPIDEAVQYLDDLDVARLLPLAKTGVHVTNPYHNLTHELLVVYHSLNNYYASTSAVGGTYNDMDQAARELAVAALFHDHDHSGGKHKDYDNISRAILRVASLPDTVDYNKNVSIAMISKTEFTDGKFPSEPKTFREECLRDADLCSIYTTRGQMILMELPREFGHKAAYRMGKPDRIDFLKKNKEFLQNAKMYTEYGNMMKEFHLDRACEDFEDLISRAAMVNHTPSYSNWNAV